MSTTRGHGIVCLQQRIHCDLDEVYTVEHLRFKPKKHVHNDVSSSTSGREVSADKVDIHGDGQYDDIDVNLN